MEFEKGDIVEVLTDDYQWFTKGKHYEVFENIVGYLHIIDDDGGDSGKIITKYCKLVKRADMKDKNCITLNGVDITLTDEQVKQIEGVVKQEEIIRVPDCINISIFESELRLHTSENRKIVIMNSDYYIYPATQTYKTPMKLVKTTFEELEEGDIFTCGLSYLVDMDDYNVKVNNERSIYSLEDDVSSAKFEEDRIVYKVVKID